MKIKDVTSRFNTGNLGNNTSTPCESAASHMWPCATNVSKLILPNPAKSAECFPRNANDAFRRAIYPII